MKKLAIFDLDGTLLNTIEDLKVAMNVALAHFGYPTHDVQACKRFVGNGIYKLVERSLPEDARDEANVLRVKAVFDAYYGEHSQDLTTPYEGILTMLDSLNKKGIHCGVVTNKSHDFAVALMAHYFGDKIDMVLGQREGVPTKPHPQSVLEMMAHFHCESEACVYIGDSDVDIHTAQAAGVTPIGVLWGFRDEAVLREAGATLLASDVKALEEMILSL